MLAVVLVEQIEGRVGSRVHKVVETAGVATGDVVGGVADRVIDGTVRDRHEPERQVDHTTGLVVAIRIEERLRVTKGCEGSRDGTHQLGSPVDEAARLHRRAIAGVVPPRLAPSRLFGGGSQSLRRERPPQTLDIEVGHGCADAGRAQVGGERRDREVRCPRVGGCREEEADVHHGPRSGP